MTSEILSLNPMTAIGTKRNRIRERLATGRWCMRCYDKMKDSNDLALLVPAHPNTSHACAGCHGIREEKNLARQVRAMLKKSIYKPFSGYKKKLLRFRVMTGTPRTTKETYIIQWIIDTPSPEK